jgi:hypothetical protein
VFLRTILDDEQNPKTKRDNDSECNFDMENPNNFNNKENI